MSRKRTQVTSQAKSDQQRLLWEQTGEIGNGGLADWDPKTVDLVTALLGILDTGSAIFLRPGSGGRAIGVAIWEGDVRHPAKWVYDAEELDQWADTILSRLNRRREAD